MKKIIVLFLLGLFFFNGYSQNFIAPTRESVAVYTDTATTFTYQIQDIKYPVFKSKNGAYYIWKTSSKTGKKYKYYLPKTIQIKMGRVYKTNKL